MRTQHLFLWISVLNSLVGEIALGKQKLYIGTFYGMNVSSQGWSSRGVMPAVQMALDHVNRDPVILPDFTLYEDWRDSKCDSGAAIRAMLDLMSSSPTKIMFTAPGCSPAAEPIAEAATFWGAVQVGFSNTSPLLSDDSRFPLFSRTSPSETLNNVAIVMTLLAMKWRRCAIIVQENNIFTKTKENLVYQLTEKGIKIEFVESFDDDPEYPVLNIKNKDVRIIIGLMYEDKFTKVACEAYKQRIYGRRYVWVLPGWYSEKWWENAGNKSCSKHQVKEAAGNYLATRPLRLGGSTSPTIAKKTATELSEELTEKSMRENYPINPFSSFAYDAIWSIALTLHQSSLILESRNKCLSNLTYGDSETAALFRDTLRNLNFLGMSGTVKFDKRGDRETTIEILQQQGNARVVVGFYNKSSNKIEESLLKWGGKPPTDSVIKEIEAYKASKEQTVVTMVLSLGGIMFSFVCLAVNIAYRKHRIIKMSSPHFNTITAIGGFFCYTHVLLETFNSSRIYVGECRGLCVIRAYLIIVGFTLAFGGMFAKTWRVYKIFTNRRLKREMGGLTTTKLMFRIFCILLLDILVMVSWEIIDPLQSNATEISVKPSQGNDDIEIHTTVQQCVSRHYTSWVLGIMVFKGILLLFGVFLAWETRNVHYAELNDSKNIGVAVYNILLFSGLNITAEFVLSDLMAKRIFNNCLIYLCTTMVLGLVFLPKISRLTRKTQVRQPEGSQDQIQSHQSSLGNVNGQMSAGFVVSEIKQTSK